MEHKEKKIEKINFYITAFLRITIIVAIILELINQNWLLSFVTFLILIATYFPNLIERQYKINLPTEFELLIIIFLYAALFLGEIQSYYARFWWWDIILHIGAGMAFGFIGFLLLYGLYYKGKIQAKPFWIFLFSFSFALALGTLWEIFEFAMDQIFGFNMQKSGLVDTMWDLIVDAIGALITSLIGFYYIKKQRHSLIKKLLRKIIQ